MLGEKKNEKTTNTRNDEINTCIFNNFVTAIFSIFLIEVM